LSQYDGVILRAEKRNIFANSGNMVGLARLFIGGVGLYGAIYTYDYNFRYQRLHRNVRTVLAAASTIIDYKVVYGLHPERLEAIHDRVATRLAETCARNGGLYIKLGQSIASLNHVLPPTYRRAFEVLQDQAPATPYSGIYISSQSTEYRL
tara:strand:+ start:1882 stop:2334 length:453 start_codon:yes stop_codon:yes gene_type:complete